MALIFKGNEIFENDDLRKRLKEHIEKDKLIGIPTETVYGLGGNSLSEKSLENIFRMKNRPVSDPIISHVYNIYQAYDQLYHINMYEKYIIYILNKHFWPGPLSIIARSKKQAPLILTAYTQFCAVRVPDNIITREIIKICNTPIAAPSANKFQHISPTNCLHVYEEFKNEDLLIFDDGQCDIGIESTVLKITKYKIFDEEKKKEYVLNKKKNINGMNDIKYAQHINNINVDNSEENNLVEIITDEEYECEYNEELPLLRVVTNSKGSESNIEVYEKLKNMFDLLEHPISYNNNNNIIVDKILKYKSLYNYSIKIYRRGKYTKFDIQNVLNKYDLLKDISVEMYEKIKFENLDIFKNEYTKNDNKDYKCDNNINNEIDIYNNNNNNNHVVNISCHNNSHINSEIEKNEVCPGLLLTHYSPFVSTYLLDIISYKCLERNENTCKKMDLNKCILLDIGGSLLKYDNKFLKYINICYDSLEVNERIKYITKQFFLYLRQAERLAIENKADNILISIVNIKRCDENYLSIFDRIYRAASGKLMSVCIDDKDLSAWTK
ncbi:threonylcarbamoyl-AMP synthase, putative [Plasmodium gaboni]|uniref:Threonylcarbamoyl-AMP synthase n=1 Tax=Plasmodium gaboni TaxID=647221 RepID=A0ABY1UPS1_9APIC|nr:threonylcarbamoyl-AMP synthase, putative [Plasmodium gaboni]